MYNVCKLYDKTNLRMESDDEQTCTVVHAYMYTRICILLKRLYVHVRCSV